MILVVIPKSVPVHIIQSQIVNRSNNLYEKGSVVYYVSCSNQVLPEGSLIITQMTQLYGIRNKIKKVYFRSVFDFFIFISIAKLFHWTTSYDFRGLISEESYLRNGSSIRKLILSYMESLAFKLSDEVYCVSDNLKLYLRKHFGNKHIKVIPCCVMSSEVSFKNNVRSNIIKFIYVGSVSSWQGFERACSLYKSIESNNTTFTVVTKDKSKATEITKNAKINVTILSGDRNFCLEQMSQADFGFILREKSIINETASPIKFLEYTSQGVIPIMSKYVGDYSDFFKSESMVINSKDKKIDKKDLVIKLDDENIHQRLYKKTKMFTWTSVTKL